MLVCQLNGLPEVVDLSISVGVLEEHSTHILTEVEVPVVLHHHLHTQVIGPGAHNRYGLRVALRVH